MRVMRASTLALLAMGCLSACAFHREAGHLEQEALSNAEQAVIQRVVDFVRTHDTPRLTGTELAQAGVAACGKEVTALREMALEQGHEWPAVDSLISGIITLAQQTALASLAARDKNK